MSREEPKGLGGWLILVAFGLIVTPFRVLTFVFGELIPVWTEGHWGVLTDPNNDAYHVLWGPLLVSELVFNIAVVLAAGFALTLFFMKSPRFPKFMIAYMLVNFAFITTDFFVARLIPAVAETNDSQSIAEMGRSAIACLIWVPYFMQSKRVRNTFVDSTPPLVSS